MNKNKDKKIEDGKEFKHIDKQFESEQDIIFSARIKAFDKLEKSFKDAKVVSQKRVNHVNEFLKDTQESVLESRKKEYLDSIRLYRMKQNLEFLYLTNKIVSDSMENDYLIVGDTPLDELGIPENNEILIAKRNDININNYNSKIYNLALTLEDYKGVASNGIIQIVQKYNAESYRGKTSGIWTYPKALSMLTAILSLEDVIGGIINIDDNTITFKYTDKKLNNDYNNMYKSNIKRYSDFEKQMSEFDKFIILIGKNREASTNDTENSNDDAVIINLLGTSRYKNEISQDNQYISSLIRIYDIKTKQELYTYSMLNQDSYTENDFKKLIEEIKKSMKDSTDASNKRIKEKDNTIREISEKIENLIEKDKKSSK